MCGIAGILSLAPGAVADPAELRAMTATLAHRGPDEAAEYFDPQHRCALGFRRLSIIDLATGRQPISNEDGRVWLVFNGEIYNFPALRRELEPLGHAFQTRSDAETIVHAYEQWGDECVQRLAGMFAFAIWDELRGRLLLARDRFGKKPLVYAVHRERLYFASELKALLAVPGLPREITPQALHEYLLLQYVPAPGSIYRGVSKLPPASVLAFSAHASTTPTPHRYWSLPPGARFSGSYEDGRERVGELLTHAVEKRLVSDVPLGAFLSGGVDSSIVVALMRRLGVSPLRTFSIGFPDPRYDETRYARLVAQRFDTEHHEHIVTPRAAEILDALAYHYDEPFGDSSAIPTYYVSRYTRQSVTVALTGDGGDELFLGYDRYRAAAWAARLEFIPRPARGALATLADLLPTHRAKSRTRRAARFLAALDAPASRRYLSWVNAFTPAQLAAGYTPDFARRIQFDAPLQDFDRRYELTSGAPAERANRVDLETYLPFDLLTKVDTASMACSLECRSPFLDHQLAEFALTLPPEWRMTRAGGKRILKDWAAQLLPPELLHRPKMGFGIPVGEWFRGELREALETTLLAPDAICARVFQRDWLTVLLRDHVTSHANHEHALWLLFMLEAWAKRWNPTWTAG
ncbi:MAG: asparagine synthase (glutamine-hydrolyzing) [Phycisphaerae bacterium]